MFVARRQCPLSSPVSVPFESEPKLQDVVAELTPEPMSPRTLPLTVHNLETNILK